MTAEQTTDTDAIHSNNPPPEKSANMHPDHLSDTPQDSTNKKHSKNKKRPVYRVPWFTRFIAWLALLLTIIGIAAGYKNWLHIHQKAKANQQKIIELEQQQLAVQKQYAPINQLNTLETQTEQRLSQIENNANNYLQKMQRLNQETRHYKQSIEAQVEDITRLQGSLQSNKQVASSKDWLIADTEYLLRMASRQLHFRQDKTASLSLLKAADENLAKIGEAHYLPVRQQLAKDIALLEQWQIADISTILQTITALAIKIEPLPAIQTTIAHNEQQEQDEQQASSASLTVKNTNEPQRTQTQTNEEASLANNTMNTLWDDFKDQLHKAIVIRKHDEPLKAAMDSDSRLQLYRLLQLRLETLKQLVLHNDNQSYHQQIKLIKETINEYYASALATPLLASLEALSQENLSPEIPDIHRAYKQLLSAQSSLSPTQTREPVSDPSNNNATSKDD